MNKQYAQGNQRTAIATLVSAVLVLSATSGYAAAQHTGSKHQIAKKSDQIQLTDSEAITDHPGWNDPALADIASHGGRMLLRQLQDVQTALKVGDIDGARHALAAANDFAQTLRPLMPYNVVSDKVRNADNQLVSDDAGVVVDQMLPIFNDTTTVTAYAPTAAATKRTKTRAGKSADEDLIPVDEDVASQVIYLPLLYVAGQTSLASRALSQDPPDTRAASQAVSDALSSPVISSMNVHLLSDESAANAS